MYLPKHFAETDVGVMHELMRAFPLATVVTFGPDGLDANHIPLHLDATAGPNGTLRGHIARANPLAADATVNRKFSLFSKVRIAISARLAMRPRPSTARWCRPGITRRCMPTASCG